MAKTENSEVIMKPVAFYPDPFRGGDNILVLTETFVWKDTTYKELVPSKTNFRNQAKKIFEANKMKRVVGEINKKLRILKNMKERE